MQRQNFLVLTPIIGIILFVVLYVLAASLYPGGSQADKNALGFNWVHNYWCNLLNKDAINGKPNKAQLVAVTAMFILCVSLSLFWWSFPEYTKFSVANKWIIKISGLSAMGVACFLFTNYDHDFITNLASALGGIAVIVSFIGLYKNGRFSFKENVHFCRIARGSLYELIDDAITMHEENNLSEGEYIVGRERINHVLKVLNGYIAYLQKQTQ